MIATGLVFTVGSTRASANGAFPDSLSVMVPAERPHDIVLATNFGLVSSEDDGQTWTWACETQVSNYATLYQMGAAPLHRLFSVAPIGLIYSDNAACGWGVAKGALVGKVVRDLFPNPGDPQHVLAIAIPEGDAELRFLMLESHDAGNTFSDPTYAAPPGLSLTGVEVARSDPKVIYMSGVVQPGQARLLRSSDGGATWSTLDIGSALGTVSSVRLVAIDPLDSQKVFLRVITPNGGERLAVTTDGGDTIGTPLVLPEGRLTSFVQIPNGVILVGGAFGNTALAYRSDDAGGTFTAMANQRHFKAFAERAGVLFAAADDVLDDFAVGMSTDQGMTWQPLMHFKDVSGIKGCLAHTCQASCRYEVQVGVWSDAVCSAELSPGGSASPGSVTDGSGCACAASPGHQPPTLPWAGLPLIVASLLRVRPRRHRTASRCNGTGLATHRASRLPPPRDGS